jgi:hypothetical protein
MNLVKRFFLCLGLFVNLELAEATDLRGRVDGIHGYTQQPFPLGGAHITLLVQNPAGGSTQVASTFSGTDGLYYFKNIKPGNNFILQVNETNYSLVVRDIPSQEIEPVLLRF